MKGTLNKAVEITNSIFDNIQKDLKYKSFELIWSIYDLVHINYSTNKVKGNLINLQVRKYSYKDFIFDFLLIVISILSIIIFKLRFHNQTLALWSGDYYNKKTKSDWRLGDLINELNSKRIPYIEFIRNNNLGLVSTLKLNLERKRPVVYYMSFINLYNFFYKNDYKPNLKLNNANHKKVLNYFINYCVLPGHIKILEKLLKILNINNFICWEFSSRQAPLIFAAKSLNIQTIGIMHGASYLNYSVHNFISPFSGEKYIGPDVFGVWSSYWKNLYDDNSKIYGSIEVSGKLSKIRKSNNFNSERKIKKILIIHESLPNYYELANIFNFLVDNFEVALKIRGQKENFTFPGPLQFLSNNVILEDDLISNVIIKYDLVIGTHSTAVLESVLFGIPFLFLNTKYLGNFFDVLESEFVKNQTELLIKIETIDYSNIDFYKTRFFGNISDDGTKWLINKIINN